MPSDADRQEVAAWRGALAGALLACIAPATTTAQAPVAPPAAATYIGSDDRDSYFAVRCPGGAHTQVIVRSPDTNGGEPLGCFRPPRNLFVCEPGLGLNALSARACSVDGQPPPQPTARP